VTPHATETMGEPMSDKQPNLQDTFLNAVRKSKAAVTIFLINGVKLQGNITWFDAIDQEDGDGGFALADRI